MSHPGCWPQKPHLLKGVIKPEETWADKGRYPLIKSENRGDVVYGCSQSKMSRYGSDDCMLYYNSKCYKGNSCQFRHEPSALTMDTTCKFWMRGNCTRFPCIFRHAWMPRKDRSHQKCHLESLKGRCSRPYCPFRHDTVEPPRISGPSAVPPVAPYKGWLILKADWRAIKVLLGPGI